MEIVIATTTATRAEHMQRELVGHTMSGEALERRPKVQFTGAADFLGAALRVYEIIAIRLLPSAQSLELVDVIAQYRPMVWHCEACGAKCGRPGQLRTRGASEYHCWCTDSCRAQVKARLDWEIQTGRVELGCDPIAAVLDYLLVNNTRVVPKRLQRLLTEYELGEVNRRFWAVARETLIAILMEQVRVSGGEGLQVPPLGQEEPHWKPGGRGPEYWQGEQRLGFLIPNQGGKLNDYHCLIDCPEETYPLYIGTYHPLTAAKKALEKGWYGDQAYRRYLRSRYNGILLEQSVQECR